MSEQMHYVPVALGPPYVRCASCPHWRFAEASADDWGRDIGFCASPHWNDVPAQAGLNQPIPVTADFFCGAHPVFVAARAENDAAVEAATRASETES